MGYSRDGPWRIGPRSFAVCGRQRPALVVRVGPRSESSSAVRPVVVGAAGSGPGRGPMINRSSARDGGNGRLQPAVVVGPRRSSPWAGPAPVGSGSRATRLWPQSGVVAHLETLESLDMIYTWYILSIYL